LAVAFLPDAIGQEPMPTEFEHEIRRKSMGWAEGVTSIVTSRATLEALGNEPRQPHRYANFPQRFDHLCDFLRVPYDTQ